MAQENDLKKPLNTGVNYSLKQSIQAEEEKINPSFIHKKKEKEQEQHQDIKVQQKSEVNDVPDSKRSRKFKIILGISSVLLVLAILFMTLIPTYIHKQIKSGILDKVLFTPENEKVWAHFPGDSGTQIIRNFTFFNFTNPEQVVLYNEKPKFREIPGFMLLQKEDYLDIEYINDGQIVRVRDWLHFQDWPQSRNMSEKVKIINVAKLGYWYQLKNARPAQLLQQGIATIFSNLQASIVNVVLSQGINSQYLDKEQQVNQRVLIPSEIQEINRHFIYADYAYGMGNKDTLSYWVNATLTSVKSNGDVEFSNDALMLMDYFTLSELQMIKILKILYDYVISIQNLILQNHYCDDNFECTGRNLAIGQLSSQYVTFNTPPVNTTSPTQTICDNNVTCKDKYPEIASFYKNVYLPNNPTAPKNITFTPQLLLSWFDHNKSTAGLPYNTEPNCLLHIGNLDYLWQNGMKYDQKKDHQSLKNIMDRFTLESEDQTRVFWEWVKYFYNDVVRQNTNNQLVGISTLFSQSLYDSFTKVQNHLHNFLITQIVLAQTQLMSCLQLFQTSFKTSDTALINTVCDYYKYDPQIYIKKLVAICKNSFSVEWSELKGLGVGYIEMYNLCDSESSQGFGKLYDIGRRQINDYYKCDETPIPYCSDYQIAVKQWANSTITRDPIPFIKYPKANTISDWFPHLTKPFEYYHFQSKFPNLSFPQISTHKGYELLNFNEWFSSSVVLKQFNDAQTPKQFKDYMRYVTIFVGMDGFTAQRSAKDWILGYTDQFLENIRTSYAPFGGDPSTPSFIAFNDLNLTQNESTMIYEISTGVNNSTDIAQLKKLNGYDYILINKTSFNGTAINSQWQSPWIGHDHFFGSNGKFFPPFQDQQSYISAYVPNLQRYGGGDYEFEETERYGFKVRKSYGSEELYQSKYENPDNEKYYQEYHGIFNETSVIGLPLFLTKNHFRSCPANWSTFVDIYNENESIHYLNNSQWDQSFFLYEPNSGVSFQTVLYLQTNYYYQQDTLFQYNQTSLMPIFSVHRSGNMTEHTAHNNLDELYTAFGLLNWLFYIPLALVILLGLLVLFAIYKVIMIRREEKKLVSQSQSDNLGISLQKAQEQQNPNEKGDMYVEIKNDD